MPDIPQNRITDLPAGAPKAKRKGDDEPEEAMKAIAAWVKSQAPYIENPASEEGIPTESIHWPPTDAEIERTIRRCKADGMYGTPVMWSQIEAFVSKAGKKPLRQGEHHTPPKGYPRDRSQYADPEHYMYPIDRKHIHAAISYFPKHHWSSGEHKQKAARRILNAARRYGVHVAADDAVSQAAGKS